MIKVQKLFLLLAMLLIPGTLCFGQSESQSEKFTQKSVGQHCVVVLKSDRPNEKTEMAGKVLAVKNDAIILAKPTVTVRVEQKVPGILGALPFVNRLFKNVGIAVDQASSNKRIKVADVRSVQFVQPSSQLVR